MQRGKRGQRGLILVAMFAATLLPLGASAQAPSVPQLSAQQAAAAVGGAATAISNSIAEVPAGSAVEAYEGAILFSISQLGAPLSSYVEEGLKAIAASLPIGPARIAVANVLQMRQRKTGTAGINGSNANLLLSGPTLTGGGSGGTSNYSF